MSEPATLAGVKQFLKLTDSRDDDIILDAVTAANAYLYRVKGPEHIYTDSESLGAIILASRLYRRRNSPDGIQNTGSEGSVYVLRVDPDVAMLLELGPYKRPKVG